MDILIINPSVIWHSTFLQCLIECLWHCLSHLFPRSLKIFTLASWWCSWWLYHHSIARHVIREYFKYLKFFYWQFLTRSCLKTAYATNLSQFRQGKSARNTRSRGSLHISYMLPFKPGHWQQHGQWTWMEIPILSHCLWIAMSLKEITFMSHKPVSHYMHLHSMYQYEDSYNLWFRGKLTLNYTDKHIKDIMQ